MSQSPSSRSKRATRWTSEYANVKHNYLGDAIHPMAGGTPEHGAITTGLQAIHDAFPLSPNREAMLEHRVPYDVATELAGTIECVVADQLRPAIEYFEAASRVTAEELREQHRERQALLRRLRGRLRDEIG